MKEEKDILLEIKNMHKSFLATRALKGIDLKISKGQIHGLVGENGSGKSTVTSIAAGMQGYDSGEMFFMGQRWKPASMIHAQEEGFSMILQEANTISGVTVAENLFAGKEWDFCTCGIVSKKKMIHAANQRLAEFGMNHIHGEDSIDRYGFEDRKLIEICRVVSDKTKVLVVDETTTALSQTGRELLYKLVRKLASEGKAVIFISHDMEEILEVCNILTVLRDGDIIGTLTKEEMEPKKIRYMMVGREIGDTYYREDFDASHSNEIVLEFKNCSFKKIKNFNLQLHKGEILGIGGLSGSGMHDVGRAAFGLEKISSGSVECHGERLKSCLDAINKNMAYISKNRDQEALIVQGSINDNIILPSIPSLTGKFMFLSKRKSMKCAKEQIEAFRIKCNNGSQFVSTLSGGNKQKVSFAKWTALGSDILIMDCPTRGVDIGVKQFMYHLIHEMKKEGKAILMISEELAELIGMCDKIMIMKNDTISGTKMRSKDLQQTDIIEYII
ncbi:ribose import ATP-binding protein RbsA [Anaerocolumna cellulosilytica]|uniref:Ribose import ATP-binding protein RbsA n=1 Tax=Anaerocolumna cellulosilytica TaxID=433286 RepID=A0A6S6QSB4_9FIRM|nr:sugar ABC transporter ATP-binding protein [Anaerocolumna cellulosilytica]MBB5194813.1 ribose transport system ATP-binding protein [Anaerocolumna cellulosilytica]BCJ94223.1 ribose import ATP-binding protein RbsA [Anaerocolumna cellulosilytica]